MNAEETTDASVARPTSLADLLAELTLPTEPVPVSLVPQTVGWPLLALFVLALAVYLGFRTVKRRRAEAYRQTALAALAAGGNDATKVAEVLRKTALSAFPRTDVASLMGGDWLAFLDRTCATADFKDTSAEALVSTPYKRDTVLSDANVARAREWILRHTRSDQP